jgi:hypothetical protein
MTNSFAQVLIFLLAGIAVIILLTTRGGDYYKYALVVFFLRVGSCKFIVTKTHTMAKRIDIAEIQQTYPNNGLGSYWRQSMHMLHLKMLSGQILIQAFV